MGLEHLFKLIRQEDCALWIGAGFSLYSGYPGGYQLRDLIFNELTTEEQAQLNPTDELKKVAQSLVTFRGGSRNALNNLLFKVYGKSPVSTHHHDLLSRIPHFKEIISTNYDSLIEDSYTRRAHVVRDDKDVAYISDGKPTIYKPHGDLVAINNVVITSNDYSEFYKKRRDTPFWSALLAILSKKTLIFLGYGFEDDNIWPWLDIIDETVGNHRKERFLIAPNWPNLKILELNNRHIRYIDMTGDAFLAELDIELQKNIATDLSEKRTSQDTVNSYFELREYNPTITNIKGRPIITNLSKTGAMVASTITFQVNDKKTAEQIQNFQKGFGKSLEIDPNHIANFNFFADHFKLNRAGEKFTSISMLRVKHEELVTAEFPDDGLEISDIKYEAYRVNKNNTIIKADISGFKITLSFKYKKKEDGCIVGVNFELPKLLPTLQKAIEFHRAVKLYAEGKRLIFHYERGSYHNNSTPLNFNLDAIDDTLNIFVNLRKIEKFYGIRFDGKPLTLNQPTINTIINIGRLIDEEYYDVEKPNGLVITRKPGAASQFKALPEYVDKIVFRGNDHHTINLLGHELELGESGLLMEQPEVYDISPDGMEAKTRSKTNVYRQLYSRFSPFELLKNIDDL